MGRGGGGGGGAYPRDKNTTARLRAKNAGGGVFAGHYGNGKTNLSACTLTI